MKGKEKNKIKKSLFRYKRKYKRYFFDKTASRRCLLKMGIDWQVTRQNIINTKQKMLDKIMKMTSEFDFFENWEGKIKKVSITEIWKTTQQRNEISICRSSFFYYLKLMKKAKIIKNSYYRPLKKDGKRTATKPGVYHYIAKGDNLKKAFRRLHTLIFKNMVTRISSYKKRFILGILCVRKDLPFRLLSFDEIIKKFYLNTVVK